MEISILLITASIGALFGFSIIIMFYYFGIKSKNSKCNYEVKVIRFIDYLINERVIEAQKEGWELNGGMTTYIDNQHNTRCIQPLKRKLKGKL